MSKTLHGLTKPYALPAQRPASGLFFLCSFLLLIGIPASSYVEILAKACLNSNFGNIHVLENGGITMQRPSYYVSRTSDPVFPDVLIAGKEMAEKSAAID